MAKLTPAELQEAVALGGTISEVRALSSDGFSFEDIKGVLLAQRETKITEADAEAARQAAADRQERENEKNDKPHPHISVYSYPEGDIARPRPALKCAILWRDVEQNRDQLTAQEIELLNQLEPGVYIQQRPDGSRLKIEVVGERDEVTNKLTKLNVRFDMGKGLRTSLHSMVFMLQAMIAQHAAESKLVTA